MKKLLAFVLVLTVASMANAALVLSVDGQDAGPEITLNPSDTIWIGVDNDTTAGFAAYVIMTDGLDFGSWTGSSIVHTELLPGEVEGWTYFGTAVDPLMDAWFYNGSIATTLPFTPGVTAEVEFHCDGPGDVFITLFDEGFAPIDGLIIHQDIPEPVTMTLLGLGGLALIRRRRA